MPTFATPRHRRRGDSGACYPNVSCIAPDELLIRDFRELDARETLRTSWENERNILIQSVAGHAQEGHGVFHGARYVNTTMDDIARALRLDPDAVRGDRQELMDGVSEYVRRVLNGGDGSLLMDDFGVPLLGMGTLSFLPEVDGKDVLRGLYLGALRDDADVRIHAETKHGLVIGGGKSYLVNLETMERAGLDADRLAHEEHDADAIERLWQSGVIVAKDGPDTAETSYLYVRHRKGCGTSDDACIVLTGLVHGFGAGVGAFLADALDTLEKYVPVFGGSDHALAEVIARGMPDLNLTPEDAGEIAYLSADESGQVPDSSLRHLLAVDRRYDQCAAEAHIAYLLGRPYAPVGLSHRRTPAEEFYAYCEARLARWRTRGATD
ncbi:MAG: hypothetical protein H7145_05595 [Akkermansiaceae bacterium]|nr:hypothetical protein [Armatimonadota bacterium]